MYHQIMGPRSAWSLVYWNGVVARTPQTWQVTSFPYRPGSQPAETDRTDCPSSLGEHLVSQSVSFQPNGSSRSGVESRWEILGTTQGGFRGVAGRNSEPLRCLSRRPTPRSSPHQSTPHGTPPTPDTNTA